jgi:DNA repair exonuclease SbcCD ATPase subunit
MIVFKQIKYKNFLSTGNSWTTIQLDKSKSTLIVGANGAGKSTILDALSFALFGKPHRNINKPQLVNTINNKDCRVELQFGNGSASYKVVRGIKPAVFEIWKNGVMINENAHATEYQKILEQNIIKLNHKSFHQIVVLGSSSFVPFMQLTGGNRREVIEDLLDINVFSKMSSIVKEKTSILKDRLKDNGYNLDILKNKIEAQQKYIRDIAQINETEINEKKIKIESVQKEIGALQHSNQELSEFIQANADEVKKQLRIGNNEKQVILHTQAEQSQRIKAIVKDSKFYADNDECPTCTQKIEVNFKEKKVADLKEQARLLAADGETLSSKAQVVQDMLDATGAIAEELRTNQSKINGNNQAIKTLQDQIKSLTNDILRLQGREGDLSGANADLIDMHSKKEELVETKASISDDWAYNTVMSEMLKDTGIKTKIIKQYIPVINQLVNQYLQVLDFYVSFDLDESFKETIKSRHRDTFSYDSFSEGEKQRIDLALLFTWRMIAKMKNSVATNLLILDETFDSSLDHDGVDNLTKILYTLDEATNTFIISHKGEILDGKFKEKIEFAKEKNFSKISSVQLETAMV